MIHWGSVLLAANILESDLQPVDEDISNWLRDHNSILQQSYNNPVHPSRVVQTHSFQPVSHPINKTPSTSSLTHLRLYEWWCCWVRIGWLQVAVWADISGFTKLGEKMASRGYSGAQYLAEHLNVSYPALVNVCEGLFIRVFFSSLLSFSWVIIIKSFPTSIMGAEMWLNFHQTWTFTFTRQLLPRQLVTALICITIVWTVIYIHPPVHRCLLMLLLARRTWPSCAVWWRRSVATSVSSAEMRLSCCGLRTWER